MKEGINRLQSTPLEHFSNAVKHNLVYNSLFDMAVITRMDKKCYKGNKFF